MNRSALYLLLLFISIMLFNVGDDGRSRTSVEDALVARQKELDTIHNMTYRVNVTHPTPPVVRSGKQALLDHAHSEHPAHFYHNVTGVFKGDWHAENVTFAHLNRTAADEARGSFAYDSLGKFTLNLKCIATEDEDISYIEAHMRMRDDDRSDYGVLLFAEGLHFLTNGTLYLYGVPDSHGIPLNDLLQTLPSNDTFMRARRVVEGRLQERIERLQEMLRFGYDTTEDEESPYSVLTDCEFEMLIQLQPVPKNIKMSQLLEYERELQNPQGVTTIRAPPLVSSFMIYSPNCGVLISAPDAPGLKVEKYYAKAINYAAMVSALALAQIFLLIHQMEYTPTPSSVSKVSYWTIAIQSVMDGYLCLLHLTTSVVIGHVFIPFATAAFFTFILVSIFGMRYLLVIWRIQRPEYTRNVIQQTVSAVTGVAEPQRNEAGAERAESRQVQDEAVEGEGERAALVLPPPVTAPRALVRETGQTEERRDLGVLYYRLYTALLLGLLLFYQIVTRSTFVQNLILGGLVLALFSFWVPQVVRNAVRGSRRGLSLYYVAGMSVTRLATPLYFYGCPHNLLGHEATPWVWGLAAYVTLQALVLVAQEYFGPRFFVPEQYLPPTYNYHPILPPTDEESAADDDGADDEHAHTPRQQGGGAYPRRPHYAQPHGRDCAICMLPVDTGAPGSTATAAVPILGRAAYMVTPCHHLFHTECLERWMRIKLECPVCRSFLPSS